MGTLTGIELTNELEGRYYHSKMQWICIFADFKEKESGREWDLYWWPAIAPKDEGIILTLHNQERGTINLCQFHQPEGTITWPDLEGANIDYPGRTQLTGHYPNYHIEMDAPDRNGQTYQLSIDMVAESKAFEAVPDLTGITWHYIPRMRLSGTLTTHEGTVEIEGQAYLERRRGRFWSRRGEWALWEGFVQRAPGELGIPLFYKVWEKDGDLTLQTLTYTNDGENLVDLGTVDVEILETQRYDENIEHPIKYRATAEGPEGKAVMTVTRDRSRLECRDFWTEPQPEARAVGIYGPGSLEATVEDANGKYEAEGRCYGSALYFWTEE